MTFVHGRDAAFASNIGGDFSGVVTGYFGGPNAYHVWEPGDWVPFRNNHKLPVWVSGYNADKEIPKVLEALSALGVPPGKKLPIALDMEKRVDPSYVQKMGEALQEADFRVLVYGSASTLFGNPQLNGYWVAGGDGSPFMHPHMGVRGTQWAWNIPPGFDVSLWKEWVVQGMWR